MPEPFLGEIRMLGFGFPPTGWALCDGQLLPINQNQSLYSLLGDTYGGDGRTTFALPDLRGRVPIHVGEGFEEGQRGGAAAHPLSVEEMPAHGHTARASDQAGDTPVPADAVLGRANNLYAEAADPTSLRSGTIAGEGDGRPHQNMQPYLGTNFVIALRGLFPTRN